MSDQNFKIVKKILDPEKGNQNRFTPKQIFIGN